MKRIRVPEGALSAAIKAAGAQYGYTETTIGPHIEKDVTCALEAALLWLSEHPQVPTDEQAQKLLKDLGPTGVKDWSQSMWHGFIQMTCEEWQRRCFVQEEPEIPEEIRGLMKNAGDCATDALIEIHVNDWDEAVLEAYKIGLRKGEQK